MFPKSVRGVGLLVAAGLVVLGAVAVLESIATEPREPTRTPGEAGWAVPATVPLGAVGGSSVADIAEQVVEGVVNVSTERSVSQQGATGLGPFFNDPFFRHFFGDPGGNTTPQPRREASLGSGVIVDREGVVLTNNHVVANAERVRVTLADGREFDAEIVGTDPPTDLAVLRIRDVSEDLPSLSFGDSDDLRLGDAVLAVGNPFGLGQTVTMGIVSAKGRANVGLVDYEDFIQTDAAINPGNSGGALVDMQGRLVGVNTAIVSRSGGYQGIGFAIPANMAELVMGALLRDGKVERGWLGVSIQKITPDLATALDLDERKGVLVGDVVKDSPAAEAGLRRGDIILRFDGQEVSSPTKLRNLVAVAGADERVSVDFLRDAKEHTVTVTLGELESQTGVTLDREAGALGGLTVAPLDDARRRELSLPESISHGVVVTEVQPRSPAGRAGFRPGDVILEINRRPVDGTGELRRLYDEARGSVAILVQRGRTTFFLALQKP